MNARKTNVSAAWGKRFLVLANVILMANLAYAASPKIAKDLNGRNVSGQVDVIVQFKQSPTARHHQKVLSRGGVLRRELGLVNSSAYRVPAAALAELAADPDVAYVSPDRPLASTGSGIDTNAVLDYYIPTINAQFASGYDGTGVGVAVIDSGMIDIPDLHNSKGYEVVYAQDFVGGGTVDKYGHGSHVAGIIGGTGKNSTGSNYSYTFKGIAPGVSLVNLRVLDQNGQGTDSNVIAAIKQAISLKSKYNIRVINLSLGRPVYESYTLDPLCLAVEEAWKAGIVVVVAAGNEGRNNSKNTSGYGTITAPGNDPYATLAMDWSIISEVVKRKCERFAMSAPVIRSAALITQSIIDSRYLSDLLVSNYQGQASKCFIWCRLGSRNAILFLPQLYPMLYGSFEVSSRFVSAASEVFNFDLSPCHTDLEKGLKG